MIGDLDFSLDFERAFGFMYHCKRDNQLILVTNHITFNKSCFVALYLHPLQWFSAGSQRIEDFIFSDLRSSKATYSVPLITLDCWLLIWLKVRNFCFPINQGNPNPIFIWFQKGQQFFTHWVSGSIAISSSSFCSKSVSPRLTYVTILHASPIGMDLN